MDRALPANLDAERAVLASMILEPAALDVALEKLLPRDFFSRGDRAVFQAVAGLARRGSAVDLLTVTAHLRECSQLERIGGTTFVQGILDAVPVIGNVRDHIELVKRDSKRRQLIELAMRVIDVASSTRLSAPEIIERASTDPVFRPVLGAIGDMIDAEAPGSRALVCVDSETFLANQYPKPALILEPWLRESQLAMAYGWRGTGKSWLAAGIACAVASAGTFLRWRSPSSRRVVLVDGELPAATLQDRIRSTCKVIGAKPAQNLQLIAMTLQEYGIPSLDTEEGQRLIDAHLEGSSLLVLDSLSTLVRSGTLNDEETWLPVQAWLIGLRTRGISVLLIHHSGKSGAQRGHSRIEDCLDVSISLRQPDDYCAEQGARFEIKFEKTRGLFGEAASGFEALLQTGPDGVQEWTTRDLVDARRSRIMDLQREGLSQKEIAKKIGCHTSTVSRHLKAARSDGSLVKKEA